jgi:hypothetical protein
LCRPQRSCIDMFFADESMQQLNLALLISSHRMANHKEYEY